MLEQNLIKIYEYSFREHHDLPALTDYFKGEKFTYFEVAKEIAKRINTPGYDPESFGPDPETPPADPESFPPSGGIW